jgi:hypothetical protein
MRATSLIAILMLQGNTPAASTSPSLAFDHVWIQVTPNAPEAQALANAGFKLPAQGGRPHAGMGTASTAVMFRNAYLELLWVEDPHALRQVAPSFAHTLLGGADASPFGIGLRRATDVDDLHFESISISAEWLRGGESIEVARRSNEGSTAPPIFVVPRYMGYPEFKDQFAELQSNSLGVRDVTRVRLHGPGLSSAPPVLGELDAPPFVEFVSGEEHLLELEFDERVRGRVLDLRPTLCLVIRY